MRKTTIAVLTALIMVMATAALAKPSFDNFDAKDGWACDDELQPAGQPVPNHCLNIRSRGKTLNIKVFEPDPRGPQESASVDPKADARPCPHDGDADSDGTWWEYTGDLGGMGISLYVCHHSGQQPDS